MKNKNYDEWEIECHKKWYDEFTKRVNREMWIDRSGEIHRLKFDKKEIMNNIRESSSCNIASLHSKISGQLYPKSKDPNKILFKNGWIMVGSKCSGTRTNKEPSNLQCKTLKRLNFLRIYLLNHKTNDYEPYLIN